MDIKTIALRAAVTAVEAVLAVLLATGLTDLTSTGLQTALVTGAAAGLSVIYNAVTTYLNDQPGPSAVP